MIRRILPWVSGAVLVALYGYALVGPIGNLIGLPSMGFTIGAIGWFWLIAGIAAPPVALLIALLVGRGRTPAIRLLLLATGLTVLSLLQFQQTLLIPVTSYFA